MPSPSVSSRHNSLHPLLSTYIEDHISPEPEHLRRLERTTNLERINGRMCSGHVQGRLLKMLTQMINPHAALELGTFTGYSAICIAEGLAPGATLTTVEVEDELEGPILEAFREAGADNIVLRIGDAMEVMQGMPDSSFQLIFIDADKRQYPDYYREAKRLLAPGGFIIADNILWDGHVVESGRHDRQTEGVRAFNDIAASDPDMEVAIIPLRDGLSIIRKRTPAPPHTLYQ